MEQFPQYNGDMTERTLEDEVMALRTEVASLKAQLEKALAVNAQLQTEVDRYRNQPPSFVKANTPKSKANADKANLEKKPRRKRAKDQNGARRRELVQLGPNITAV